MAPDLWAVVPVKELERAKERLAPLLAPALRRALMLAMLEDVLAALAATPPLAGIVVATVDAEAERLARRDGAAAAGRRSRRHADPARRCAARNPGRDRRPDRGASPGPGFHDRPLARRARLERGAVFAAGGGAAALWRRQFLSASRGGRGARHPPDGAAPAGSGARYRYARRSCRLCGSAAARPDGRAARGECYAMGAPGGAEGRSPAMRLEEVLEQARAGERLGEEAARRLVEVADPLPLMRVAAALRDRAHGPLVSYSKKVFIPLTRLCRDVCHYCTFARPPRPGEPLYLDAEAVLAIARAGARAGCREALFTLGVKPELRYAAARRALDRLGHASTLSYLAAMAGLVLRETGLLPHLNAGVMSRAEIVQLREVSVSQGLMLESIAERLGARGGPHFGSPDKQPAVRLATIAAAGEAAVPFTSGILIGIGETRGERIDSLLALRALHERYGHIQEIIIQNFRAKPGTRMAHSPEPDVAEHLWTIAAARLIFGAEMNIQAPPNLNPDALGAMIAAGINGWGGASPVTPDHVNPEAPWPALTALRAATAAAGKQLVERLAIYPAYARDPGRWLAPALRTPVLRVIDADGLAREDGWVAGTGAAPPAAPRAGRAGDAPAVLPILERACSGETLAEEEIVRLSRR